MELRFKHIRQRFLLQLLYFVVYIATVGFILGICLTKTRQIQKVKYAVTSIENNLQLSYSLFGGFLLQHNTDENFVTSGENTFTQEFAVNLSSAQDSITRLSAIPYLQRSFQKTASNDSLQAAINSYNNAFNIVVLSCQEKGIKNAGNIKSMRNLSNNLLELLLPAYGTALYSQALELKELESEYLFASSPTTYGLIEQKLDELSTVTEFPKNTNIDLLEYQSLIENYKNKFQYISTIFERLGEINSDEGLIADFKFTYQQLQQQLNHFNTEVFSQTKNAQRSIFIIALIAFVLISILFAWLLFNLYTRIKHPLLLSNDFAHNLSKGKINTHLLPNNFPYEFNQLSEYLNVLNTSTTTRYNFIDSLLKQHYKIDLPLLGKNDSFGKTLLALKENMSKAQEEQIRYAEENKLRRYFNEGVAKFADVLRSNSGDLTNLSDAFIRELVRYLDGLQGGLFLINEQNANQLDLVAAFAYNRKKYLKKSFELGEGLIGTCALELKSINLTEFPENYIEITSGLGDTPPNNLLLMPVMHEGILIGVVEIASLNKFEKQQVEVGENVASSLAATIIAARNNTQTSELLKKSQQQAAVMSEQEEEMRQNLEELKATQEESGRREEELEGILSALYLSFYAIEYTTDGHITKVNEKVALLLGQKSSHLIGKTHKEIFGKTSKVDEVLFASIAEGNAVEHSEQVTANKKAFEIKNNFSPIRTKAGHTIRILNIFSITD